MVSDWWGTLNNTRPSRSSCQRTISLRPPHRHLPNRSQRFSAASSQRRRLPPIRILKPRQMRQNVTNQYADACTGLVLPDDVSDGEWVHEGLRCFGSSPTPGIFGPIGRSLRAGFSVLQNAQQNAENSYSSRVAIPDCREKGLT